MRRRSLTDKMIAKLERGRRYMLSDPEQRNLFLRIPPDPKAPISFAVYARDPYGKVRYGKLGTTADLTVATLFAHRLQTILPSVRNSD